MAWKSLPKMLSWDVENWLMKKKPPQAYLSAFFRKLEKSFLFKKFIKWLNLKNSEPGTQPLLRKMGKKVTYQQTKRYSN